MTADEVAAMESVEIALDTAPCREVRVVAWHAVFLEGSRTAS